MQHSNKKTIQLAVTLGQTVKELRESTEGLTLNRLANEYELYKGTLSKARTAELSICYKLATFRNTRD